MPRTFQKTVRTPDGETLEVKEAVVLDRDGQPIPEAEPRSAQVKKTAVRWLSVLAFFLIAIPIFMLAGVALTVTFVTAVVLFALFGGMSRRRF